MLGQCLPMTSHLPGSLSSQRGEAELNVSEGQGKCLSMCMCENGMGLRKTILLESFSLHYNSSFKCQLWFMACHSEAMKACSENWPAVRTGLTETGNILTCLSTSLDPATDTGVDKDGLFLAHYLHWEHCLGLWLFKDGDTQNHVKIPQVQ